MIERICKREAKCRQNIRAEEMGQAGRNQTLSSLVPASPFPGRGRGADPGFLGLQLLIFLCFLIYNIMKVSHDQHHAFHMHPYHQFPPTHPIAATVCQRSKHLTGRSLPTSIWFVGNTRIEQVSLICYSSMNKWLILESIISYFVLR